MKGLALIAVAAAFAVAFLFMSNGPTELEVKYQLYLAKYQKSYNNGDEYQMRLNLFERSLKIIDEHNSRGESYTLGINKFADMTKEEYRRFLGYKPSGEKNYSNFNYFIYNPIIINNFWSGIL